jgi:hypothetical protein
MTTRNNLKNIEFADLDKWYRTNVVDLGLLHPVGDEGLYAYRPGQSDSQAAADAEEALGFTITPGNISGLRKLRYGGLHKRGTGTVARLTELEERVAKLEEMLEAVAQ